MRYHTIIFDSFKVDNNGGSILDVKLNNAVELLELLFIPIIVQISVDMKEKTCVPGLSRYNQNLLSLVLSLEK